MAAGLTKLTTARPLPADPDPATLTAAEAADAIQAGTLSAEDLVRATLQRFARYEPMVKAYSYLDPDLAVARAREVDKSPKQGGINGLTVAVKDMIDTHDMPTQHNSPIYVDHRPGQDAAVVASCRALGAIIIGKTDTHEFAAGGRLPASRNPHDPAHTPGGSSSGSGAAVAAGFATLAFGTQTAGSMLRPASFCGIFGIKPTHGVVSREGARHYSLTLDTIGWYGRSVADLSLMAEGLRAIRRPVAPKTTVKGLRFAVCRTPMWDEAEPEAQAALEAAARMLKHAGAEIVDFDLPEGFDKLVDFQNVIMRGEGRAAFLSDYLANHHLLAQDFRDRVEDADNISFERLAEALDFAAACRPQFDEAVAEFDAVLTLGAVGEAPRSLLTTGNPLFQRLWTVLHVPCVALPGFMGPTGMPIGVQLIASRYGDADLLDVAAAASMALEAPRVDPVPMET